MDGAGQSEPKRLLRRLRSLPETAMRSRVLLEHFQRADAEEIYGLLSWLTAQVAKRRPAAMQVLDAVHQALQEAQQRDDLYERVAEVYQLAREQQQHAVTAMLLNAAPQRGPLEASQLRGDVELSRLTLGERKFLARGRDRQRLERLLLDPDPAVIANLLRNPQLTERDVVGLAARRPTRDVVQRQVAASRFGNRYPVRLALVCNPYTPTDLSLKLLSFLLGKDLRQVKVDRALHPLVRQEAERLLRERHPAQAGSDSESGGEGKAGDSGQE